MVLASYHPGQSVETVRAATGWDCSPSRPTRGRRRPPPPEDIAIVRDCDPAGVWTR